MKQHLWKNYILVCWLGVVMVSFSIIKTKLHWYIIPVYPSIAIIAGWGVDKTLKKYSVIVVATVAIVSLGYFGVKKDLFYQDHNPDIKEFAANIERFSLAGDKIYYSGADDPAEIFYLGRIGEMFSSNALNKVIGRSGNKVVIAKRQIVNSNAIKGKTIASHRDLIAVRIDDTGRSES